MSITSRKFKRILDIYYQNQNRRSHDQYISNALIDWLCRNSQELRGAIKSKMLNRLSDDELGYLISTLEFEDKNQFALTLIKDKLEIIKSNQIRGNSEYLYPNLYALYSKLMKAHGGEKLYIHLVNGCKDTNYIAANTCSDIIDILANSRNGVLERINFYGIDFRNITNFNKKHLKTFLDYDCDAQLKNVVFNHIWDQESIIQKLSNLSEDEFDNALEFMFRQDSFQERIHLMDILIQEGKYNHSLADRFNRLPLSFIKYLGSGRKSDGSMEKFKISLLNNISCMDLDGYTEEYCAWIINTPKEQSSNLLKLVVNENFCTFSMQKRSEIIHELGFLGYDMLHPERDQERYRKKRDFLVGDLSNPGFLTEIDDDYLRATFNFINEEEAPDVLDAKFLVLNRIKNQIKDQSLTEKLYESFLNYLDRTIKDMDSKDKIKYLDSHSKYFEKHSLEDFIEKLNSSEYKDELVIALNKNKKYKQLKYHYKFVEIANQYHPNVGHNIMNQLLRTQNSENCRIIFKTINNESFRGKSVNEQQKLLKQVSNILEVIDNEVCIPDYLCVQKNLRNQQRTEESGSKIKMKLNERDSQKKD